ncbi:hypothetical protein H0264_29015 [Nocardia huaxiensis]|uniref:Uncharacterized protein n=1 Tax=Nocardia huaxiensis TaxID=2755382 RepID=A0A7D6V962_9NOCA|nr:hypothetical protein [Nocardia huaxiensis]QLY29291.1 hypothetical protein H0264_29015 [Nocardia huaxiensis]
MADRKVQGWGEIPVVVRVAGVLVAIEGAVATVAAGVAAALQSISFGMVAAALAILVLVAGIEVYRGRWWPRTIVVISQILLAWLAWMFATGGDPWVGIPVGVVAVGVLALLFSPPSNRWMAHAFDLEPPAGESNSGQTA